MDFADHGFFNHVQSNTSTSNFIRNTDDTTPASLKPSKLYLLKDRPPPDQVSGSMNMLVYYKLEGTYNKFSGKKLKESLSSFLPDLPNVLDVPGSRNGSSLRGLIEKPPVATKEIQPLQQGTLMAAFRLHPGALPENLRPDFQHNESKKQHKHKRKSKTAFLSHDSKTFESEESTRKPKKSKKHDEEKRKKKKDKKERKERKKEKGQR